MPPVGGLASIRLGQSPAAPSHASLRHILPALQMLRICLSGRYVSGLSEYLAGTLTQGSNIAELEDMLQDLYEIYREDQKENPIERKTGNLRIAATA